MGFRRVRSTCTQDLVEYTFQAQNGKNRLRISPLVRGGYGKGETSALEVMEKGLNTLHGLKQRSPVSIRVCVIKGLGDQLFRFIPWDSLPGSTTVPTTISSDRGATGQGPLGSTLRVSGSIPQDLSSKDFTCPFLPKAFTIKSACFWINGIQVALKSTSVPSLSKMISRQGMRLSRHSIPITSTLPVLRELYHKRGLP